MRISFYFKMIAIICLLNQAILPQDTDAASYYVNPVIFSDYSDPDVVKVGDDFYLTASSFSNFPGLPVLHSKDLVHWKLINYAANNYPFPEFKTPQHGKGIWAPSIRYHDGKFWIFFGDPDHGILMTTSENPAGEWTPLKLVIEGKGLIDPCPFWDDDGKAYLIHAWAKSRAGFNGILTLRKMSSDGESVISERVDVFSDPVNQKTIEGPKFYKRDEYYYILAPAGGVKQGWQTVLRSREIYGPYEPKVVLEQGSTIINGPHQGGMIELDNGSAWFIHFQDRGIYGRIVHLNPVFWKDGWPFMGIDLDGNGIGEPVIEYNLPLPAAEIKDNRSDEFDRENLNLHWQWESLPKHEYYSISERAGFFRLFSNSNKPLNRLPNLPAQKFPAEEFEVITRVELAEFAENIHAGLVILGSDYSAISLEARNGEWSIVQSSKIRKDADSESINSRIGVQFGEAVFKVKVYKNQTAEFFYKEVEKFNPIGEIFNIKPGKWIGAKVGLFCAGDSSKSNFADFEFFRIIY